MSDDQISFEKCDDRVLGERLHSILVHDGSDDEFGLIDEDAGRNGIILRADGETLPHPAYIVKETETEVTYDAFDDEDDATAEFQRRSEEYDAG